MEKSFVQMVIRVAPDLHNKVKKEAARHNLPMSVYLRLVLDFAVKNYVPSMLKKAS